MRILVVDDDYVSRLLLKELLRPHGDVDSASDGELAICMFEKASEEGVPYDLVTMDIGLPDMRGQDVLLRMREYENRRKLYASDSEAKFLMVTGMTDSENVAASYQEGCEGYLTKPVSPEDLDGVLAGLGVSSISSRGNVE